jgi:hypothetical protein
MLTKLLSSSTSQQNHVLGGCIPGGELMSNDLPGKNLRMKLLFSFPIQQAKLIISTMNTDTTTDEPNGAAIFSRIERTSYCSPAM